jgi:hypothetical protein
MSRCVIQNREKPESLETRETLRYLAPGLRPFSSDYSLESVNQGHLERPGIPQVPGTHTVERNNRAKFARPARSGSTVDGAIGQVIVSLTSTLKDHFRAISGSKAFVFSKGVWFC